MKKKFIYGLLAVFAIIALNVQWLGQINLFTVANAGTVDFNINFDINGIGYDFLLDDGVRQILQEGNNVNDVVRTTVVSNPAISGITNLICSWNCGEDYWYPQGFKAIPQMCTEGYTLVLDIQEDINAGRTGDWDGAGGWGDNSVYDAGEKVAWDGLWVWERYNITTGIGWTGWWVGLANYCEANGWWSSSNKSEITYGSTSVLVFTIADTVLSSGTFGAELLVKDTNEGLLRMRGNYTGTTTSGSQTVTTPSFNSPFIYFENMPDGEYSVALDSEWDMYQSVMPAFSDDASWEVLAEQDSFTVAGKESDNLFYELAMHRIDLSRNGKNFSSKEELTAYLEESDFFDNLHMTEIEKQNSLEYLAPRLPNSENYYLTILTEDAVSALSKLSVTPSPEQTVRTYYAIYPTDKPVSVSSDLVFPQKYDTTKSTVKEYGEIIVKPDMYVFWK